MFRFVRRTAGIFFIISVFLIISCATSDMRNTDKVYRNNDQDSRLTSLLKIKNNYSELTLKRSLVQFHEILRSYDYFNQFIWGDYIFEDYLTTINGLDSVFFQKGEGSEVSVYDDIGNVTERIRRCVIDSENDGGIWWQVEHEKGDDTVFYELLTDRFSVPVEVRFRDPETGKGLSRFTMIGKSILDKSFIVSDAEIKSALANDRSEDVREKILPIYENSEFTGEEIITAGGRRIKTAHYRRIINGSDDIDIWYSPDIPQGIVRIKMGDKKIAEITDWIAGAERKIPEESLYKIPTYTLDENTETAGSKSASSGGKASDPAGP